MRVDDILSHKQVRAKQPGGHSMNTRVETLVATAHRPGAVRRCDACYRDSSAWSFAKSIFRYSLIQKHLLVERIKGWASPRKHEVRIPPVCLPQGMTKLGLIKVFDLGTHLDVADIAFQRHK